VTRLRAGLRGIVDRYREGGRGRDVSLLQKSPTGVETIQPPIQWVANELGEESMELNLHPPTRLHCVHRVFISFYSTQSGAGRAQSVQRLGYGLDGPGFRNPEEKRNFSFLKNDLTGCGVHPGSCSVGTGVLSRGYSGRCMKFNIHLHLVPSWRGQGQIYLPLLRSQSTGAGVHQSVLWLGCTFEQS